MQSRQAVALVLLAFAAGGEGAFPLAGASKSQRRHQQVPVVQVSETLPGAEAPQDVNLYAVPKPAVAVAAPVITFESHLPPVATVLSSATRTLESISSEVTRLETHVQDLANADQGKLARKKADFEGRLEAQQEQSSEVNATNLEIATEVSQLKSKNLGLRQRAKALQKQNELMRHELKDIEAKLAAATTFIVGSLGKTDDHKAKELAILQVDASPKRAPHPLEVAAPAAKASAKSEDSDDDEEDSDDSDDDSEPAATSLLALGRSSRPRGGRGEDDRVSEALIGTLTKGIQQLTAQNKKASLEMDQAFKEDFQAGQARRSGLLHHQEQLNTTRATLTTIGAKLEKADAHLDATRQHLERRLRAVGLYLQRLAHLILAPPQESQALIARLPKAVELPAVTRTEAPPSPPL